MAVLTLKNDNEEYRTFPTILKDYASYESGIRGTAEKTVCEYLLDLRTFFRYYKMVKFDMNISDEEFLTIDIKDIDLADVKSITTDFVIKFLMYTGVQRKNNTSTRMRKLSSLRSFYHYAYGRRHLVDFNPVSDIDAPKKAKTLPKYLTYDEALKLLSTVKNDIGSPTCIRDYAIICMFLNTGMRLSELVGLNIESFDPDLSKVKVKGKGNKERIIYLNDSAKSALKTYLHTRLDPKYVRCSDHALFLSRLEKRISNKTVQWIIYKYLDLAGLGAKGLSVHKLRHTAATLMYQSGKVDVRVLKDVLGHEQLNTTQIYTHLISADLKQAVDNNPLADIKIKSYETGEKE